MPTLPTNPHNIGDSGHVNDHNTIVTALSDGVYQTPSANQTITSDAATRKPLAIKAHASQSANLQEWQNSSGTALASVSSAGNIIGGGLDFIAAKTFSAVSSVSFDGCFTSEYEDYRIVTRIVSSANTWAGIRLRASGTDNATAGNYFWAATGFNSTNAAANDYSGSSADGFFVALGGSNNGKNFNASLDIYGPKVATIYTSLNGINNYGQASNNVITRAYSGQMTVNTAYDGLTIYCISGTLTGTARIYGYGS